jgi:hypothetical protein
MTEYTHCPDCSTHLGKDRTKCRCGWAMPQLVQMQENPNHIPCAADPNCRHCGRMWVEGLPQKARICIEHYAEDPRRFKSQA